MRLGFLIALAIASSAFAEGPGSRLRSTPEVALPPQAAPLREEPQRCDGLRDQARERCLAEARLAPAERRAADGKTVGPESTGMGSGAGAGAASGTTGGAAAGGSAPR